MSGNESFADTGMSVRFNHVTNNLKIYQQCMHETALEPILPVPVANLRVKTI